MLVRLLYASRASQPNPASDVDDIVATSHAANARHGVTGVLCYGNGVYLQVLEGSREAVSRLFMNIARDPRHHDILLLHFHEVNEREFSGWSMGCVSTARINPATLLRFSAMGELDPWHAGSAASLALLRELTASAAIAGRPADRPRTAG